MQCYALPDGGPDTRTQKTQVLYPLEEFENRVDDMLEEFKNCPPAPGVKRVLIPGELEAEKERASMRDGIEISDAVAAELREVGKTYGVTADF